MSDFATSDAMFDSAPTPAFDPGQAAQPAAAAPAEAKPAEPAPNPAPETPAAEPAQVESTTPDESGEAKPEEAASALPKELEPHKDFLANKGLDPKAADFLPRVVKMAQEAEGLIGRKGAEIGMVDQRAQDLQRQILTGGIDFLNRQRELNGLPKINAEVRSYADQIKETSELIAHINGALQNKPESVEWLNTNLLGKLDKLKLDAAVEGKLGNTPAEKAYDNFLQNSTANINKFVAENKDKLAHLDALMPLLDKGGLLHSHGVDRAHMAATPERLAAWAKVGEAVWLMQPDPKAPGKTNLDTYVAAKVQAERNAERLARNQGRPQGQPGAKNGVNTQEKAGGSPIKVGWADFHG